jgi:hypothetical protein
MQKRCLAPTLHWSLTSIQLKLIKIGARIISHSRMTVFQMAEVAIPRTTKNQAVWR